MTRSVAIFALICWGASGACFPRDSEASLREIEAAEAVLKAGRLFDLLREAREKQWAIWRMASDWSIARISDEQERRVAARAAGFARLLSAELDRLALTLREPLPNHLDELVGVWLTDLGGWIAGSPGAGNAILADRCLDLATVPLVRCILDEEVTPDQLRQYQIILSPDWAGVKYRADVLNTEGGFRIFDREGTAEALSSAYDRQAGALVRRQLTAAGIRVDQDPLLKDLPSLDGVAAPSMFFEHEQQPSHASTTRTLGLRNARRIASGLADGNVPGVLALITYRSRLGRFPEVANPSDAARVFSREWQDELTLDELRNSEFRTVGLNAGTAFERIKIGQFVDADRALTRGLDSPELTPLEIPANTQFDGRPSGKAGGASTSRPPAGIVDTVHPIETVEAPGHFFRSWIWAPAILCLIGIGATLLRLRSRRRE